MRTARKWAMRAVLLGIAVGSVACEDMATGPTPPMQPSSPNFASLQRTALQDGIAHYTYDLQTAPGPYGTVRLHRVVKEMRPGDPVQTRDAVVLLTGTQNAFNLIYLEPVISSAIPWDQSVAVFLAKNGIDVWGMDFGWALIPETVTDFGFMQDWGLARDIEDVQKALSTIRSLRIASGQGNGRLNVLGFSYSVPIVYAIAGDETQLPPGQRSVKGVIAMDTYIKVNDAAVRDASCAAAEAAQANIDAGSYENASAVSLKMFGDLAASAPNDPSPVVPGFTNLQFALFVGANDDGGHFVGGYFDDSGIPTGLRFTDPALWVDVMRAVPPYVPRATLRDFGATICDQVDVPFDDHLGEIALPILYIGSAGADGPYGFYSTTLTGSRDVTQVQVQLLSDAERIYDFGHADLFTASNAETLVWRPILDWMLAHHSNAVWPRSRAN